MLKQPPGARLVVSQHSTRQFAGLQFVRRHIRRQRQQGGVQATQDAVTHFGGGFVGKGQRQNFFGIFDHRQQTQVTLGQQLRFAGTGRCLDDE